MDGGKAKGNLVVSCLDLLLITFYCSNELSYIIYTIRTICKSNFKYYRPRYHPHRFVQLDEEFLLFLQLQASWKGKRPSSIQSSNILMSKSRSQHCYIGGGSEGLGLSLACQLAQRGAHVSIVSRSQGKLDKALLEIEVRTMRSLRGKDSSLTFNSLLFHRHIARTIHKSSKPTLVTSQTHLPLRQPSEPLVKQFHLPLSHQISFSHVPEDASPASSLQCQQTNIGNVWSGISGLA